MPLVNVRTSSGACGSQPPFPGNRAAPLLQSSISPCRQVATTTKNQETHRSSYWIRKTSGDPTTKSCCVPADINLPLPEGRWPQGAHPSSAWGAVRCTAPVTLFLSFSPAFSTLLLNPKYWLCPFIVGSGPGPQLFLCKHKGRARSACVSLLILSCRAHFWGRAPCPGISANLLRARENRLASASLCFPHLICPASSKHGRKREA